MNEPDANEQDVTAGAARRGQRFVAATILVAGAALAAGAWLLPGSAGYARVGPRLFPVLIAAGLLVTGALLLGQARAGGFRNITEQPRGPFNRRAFLWIGAGLTGHMVLIAGAGFILASAMLFAAAARGLGSTRPVRDCAVGIAIGAGAYVVFTRGLALALPWGAWLPGGA